MLNFRLIAVASAFAVGTLGMVATGMAADDPIKERQKRMEQVGKAMGTVGKMAKKETEFNAEVALAAFVSMKEAVDGFEELFPDGTQTGGDTEAAPAIFTDRAGFNDKVAKFEADLETLTASAPADLAALQASVGKAGENCGSCHKAYRVKKK